MKKLERANYYIQGRGNQSPGVIAVWCPRVSMMCLPMPWRHCGRVGDAEAPEALARVSVTNIVVHFVLKYVKNGIPIKCTLKDLKRWIVPHMMSNRLRYGEPGRATASRIRHPERHVRKASHQVHPMAAPTQHLTTEAPATG